MHEFSKNPKPNIMRWSARQQTLDTFPMKTLALAIITSLVAAAPLRAQTTGAAASTPPLSPTEETIKEIKNPTGWLTWGGDLRFRNEYLDNTLTLNTDAPLAEQDYFRYRARLWTSIKPTADLSLNARLAAEPRTWMRPAGYSPYKGNSGTDWGEGIIDNLNVQWKNILGQPLSVIVGRQDIMLGEGWLTGDGTPYDGSWTYYLDSARISYEMKEQHTVIEAIGILQFAHDDAWLPTINNQDRYQSEQDEKGMILNIVNTSIPELNLNPYFIYKHDDKVNEVTAPKTGDNADIYTLGMRITGLVKEHWKYSVEGAYQFGEKQDLTIKYPAVSSDYRDLSAFGVNTKFGYLFKDKLNNQVSLSYEYLSGDDPKTKGDEMFDVLWGRYPRWSEIGLYSFAAETRVGQQNNYHRFGPSWNVTPMKNLDFTALYYVLIAPESTPTREASATLFSHNDHFRGHFFSAILKYKFSRHLSGHLWGEVELPGDYYTNDKPMSFLRAELMLTF